MTDAATFVILFAAIIIDKCRLFPTWLGDRLAFWGYVAGIGAGFAGAGVFESLRGLVTTAWTIPRGIIDAPVTRGMAEAGPALTALLVLIVVAGVNVPVRWQKWLGTFATLSFSDFRSGPRGSDTPDIMKGPPGMAPGGLRGHALRVFGGRVNIGMVILATLFVITPAMIQGSAAGNIMNSAITHNQNFMGTRIAPHILGTVGR